MHVPVHHIPGAHRDQRHAEQVLGADRRQRGERAVRPQVHHGRMRSSSALHARGRVVAVQVMDQPRARPQRGRAGSPRGGSSRPGTLIVAPDRFRSGRWTPGSRSRSRTVSLNEGWGRRSSSAARRSEPSRVTAAMYSSCSVRTAAEGVGTGTRFKGFPFTRSRNSVVRDTRPVGTSLTALADGCHDRRHDDATGPHAATPRRPRTRFQRLLLRRGLITTLRSAALFPFSALFPPGFTVPATRPCAP